MRKKTPFPVKRKPVSARPPAKHDATQEVKDLRESLRASEAARLASETRLHMILESAQDFAIVTTGSEGDITTWSPGARAIFGYEERDVIGQNVRLLFTPEDQANDRSEAELLLAAKQGRSSDDRWLQRRDGSRFYASGLTMRLRDEHEQQSTGTGFLKILRDDTERHEAATARHRAEARFRILAESVQDYAIFLIDPTGIVTTWSKGAERVKGYDEQEALGAQFTIFYTPEDRATDEPSRELALADREGKFEKEGWRMRKDGTRYWASETIVRLGGENHELLGFAKICRDLTERRHAEDERTRLLDAEQEARKVAEAANAAKDRFLASLSHELRTPLTPIVMAVYGLDREKNLSDRGRFALDMIRRNLETETRLIDDLLDISRGLHDKLDLRLVPTDAHACLHQALEVVGPDLAAKNLRLTVSLRATRHHVCADAARLQQVFWNLLKNAIKFTPEGGWIEVRSHSDTKGKILIEVADSGIGIETDALTKIFDPFEQGSSSKARQLGGLGLGLAIAHHITQAHGGRLSAQSSGVDLGPPFKLSFPRSVSLASKGTPAKTERTNKNSQGGVHGT